MTNAYLNTIFFFLFFLSTIFLIDKYRSKIGKITGLIDRPDKLRKFHFKDTPLLGGIMIFSVFFVLNVYLFFFEEFNKTTFIVFIISTFCFIIGLIDDQRGLAYKYKFFLLIIFFFLLLSFDENLHINKIYSSFFEKKEFFLNKFSIPFTILCLLLLTNAINLIDGIDGLCILFCTTIIIWLLLQFNNADRLNIYLVVSLIYIFYLNLKKNIFLGNSGSYFLGSYISLQIIKNYNLEILINPFYIEKIFIALYLPGIDMLRVFGERIMIRKNPFSADRIHLHHLMQDCKISNNKILLIFFILILIPFLMNYFINISLFITILVSIFLYSSLIFFIKKKR